MKILIVTEKPSISKCIKNVINNNQSIFKDEYTFTSIPSVFHLDDNLIKHREYNGKIYHMKKEQGNFEDLYLTLKALEIPKHTYIYFKKDFLPKIEDFSIFDKIIGMPDPDSQGILGFQKFIEMHNLNNCYFYRPNDLTDKTILETMSKSPEKFKDVFMKTKEYLIKNNFKYEYSNNYLNINKLIYESGLSQEAFENYFNIPHEILNKYKKDIPSYIYKLIEYKLEKEGFFYPI